MTFPPIQNPIGKANGRKKAQKTQKEDQKAEKERRERVGFSLSRSSAFFCVFCAFLRPFASYPFFSSSNRLRAASACALLGWSRSTRSSSRAACSACLSS